MKDKKDLKEILTEDARRGKLGRREFMSYAAATGMSLTAASSLWSSQVAAATPKRGGTFRVGVHNVNTSDTHNTGAYQSVGEIQLAHAHRSYLTEITSDNKLGPDMADSWSATPDAKTWTFALNKEATFHSGKKFTAADAIASLNHHRGEKSTSAAKTLLESVTDITAKDEHTIVIELNQGFADLPWVMTDYHLAMVPAKDDGSADWGKRHRSGPVSDPGSRPGHPHRPQAP